MYFGCTHYPLIQEQIKKVLGDDITFFNGAPNLARHLKNLLIEKELLEQNEGRIEFIDSNNSLENKDRIYEIAQQANLYQDSNNIIAVTAGD